MKASLLRTRVRSGKVLPLILLLLSLIALSPPGAEAVGPPPPPTGTWGGTGDLNAARDQHTATLLPNGQVLVAGGWIGSSPLASAELYDPATGTWTPTGSLTTARRYHTATLLPNGQVLVAGGYGASGFLNSAELYDPATGNWTPTGSLTTSRYNYTATLLPNGQVLVAGGTSGTELASAELYDPATGNWTPVGNLATGRQGHTATLLPNGQVLVAGGWNVNPLNSAELYDPATGNWTPVGNLATGHYGHTAKLLPNGQVLLAGGINSVGSYPNSAELYEPATASWTTTGSLIGARQWATAVLLPNGQVLMAGGYDSGGDQASSELYDPALGTWRATGSLSAARRGHTATLLPNGVVLAVGGQNSGGYLATCEVYASPPANWTAATGTWVSTGPLTTGRRDHTATLLSNGKVLVAGGDGTDGELNFAEIYAPALGTWTATGSLGTSRQQHTATLLPNGKVLVAGGLNSLGPVTSAEIFDPAANGGVGAWSATGPLTTGRRLHTATLLPNGKVLVAGGYGAGGYLNSAEIFDPAANGGLGGWSDSGPLTTARAGHTATLLPNGKVLVAGGGNVLPLTSAELFDPAANGGVGAWSPTDSLATPREAHTATLLPNGLVLVAGGSDASENVTASAELFDPAADGGYGAWGPSGSLGAARGWHTATLLPNGLVLAAGGFDVSAGMNTSELYDVGLWNGAGDLNFARYGHTATLLPNGLVLVVGGTTGATVLDSAELYGVFHNVNVYFGSGGAVSPDGMVAVADGMNQTFTITPDPGCQIADVLLDGLSVGALSSYTLYNVTADHSLMASFATLHTITASAGPGGAISPAGTVQVAEYADQTFTITPNAGNRILDVLIDGVSNGARSTYTFNGVYADHTIEAVFTAGSNFVIYAQPGDISNGGTISPANAIAVPPGGSQTFTITPDTSYSYRLRDVRVDNVSLGPNASPYTFSNVDSDHYIYANFTYDWNYVIWATNGAGGYISDYGASDFYLGTDWTYYIYPDYGFTVAGVWVDEVYVGAVTEYLFSGIDADHTISVSFTADTSNHTITATVAAPFNPTGSLDQARYGHTATLLPDGRVLVAGGYYGGSGMLASAELYDPAAGTWSLTGQLNQAREFHTATLLGDGRVLVAGGNGGATFLNSAEIYDPATELWTPAGFLNEARESHTATRLPSGLVLMAGGGNTADALTSSELFDPALGYSVSTSTLAGPRSDHTATLLGDGRVLVAGGQGYPGFLARAELFDPGLGTWTTTGFLSEGRWLHTATLLGDGRVLVAGGHGSGGYLASAELYDPLAGTWGPTDSLNLPRASHTATLLDDGRVLVAGGNDGNGAEASAKLYDPLAGTWSPTGRLKTGRASHTATLLTNGRVLVAGGQDASINDLASSELYDTLAAAGGTITPAGTVLVGHEADALFTIAPNPGYRVLEVLVDGVSQGAVSGYTFANVTEDHNITATFTADTNLIITATATANGVIAPVGACAVPAGASLTFNLTPNSGYQVVLVYVNGSPVGAVSSYTFSDVTADGAIHASFGSVITASAGSGGSISPAGDVPVGDGADYTFTITPDGSHRVLDVLADGQSMGPMTSYTFYNVTSGHTIEATFTSAANFVIQAQTGGGGSISPANAVAVAPGANQTFVITPDQSDYYHRILDVQVDGVSLGPNTPGYHFSNVQADHNISAYFTDAGDFVVWATCGPGGTISSYGGVAVYDAGLDYTIIADIGYLIADVLVNGVSVGPVSNYSFQYVMGDETITANFVEAGANHTIMAAAAVPWQPTASLNTGRLDHTATLLNDGQVLLAGGGDGSGALASAELYDPVIDTCTYTGSLITGRVRHTATLLANGQVLVTGGGNAGGALASAELYDPATGLWSAGGSLTEPRRGHSATVLPNGLVLLAGGNGISGTLASAELYDPATGTSSPTGSLNEVREGHTATLLPNGQVLVAGGDLIGSAELYNPSTGLWSLTGSLSAVRWYPTGTLLDNGLLLVAGGYDGNTGDYLASAELYNPATGLWSLTGALNQSRRSHTATLLPSGQVLAAGGESGGYALASAEIYDPVAGLWNTTGDLIIGRSRHTATLKANGHVLLAGGIETSGNFPTMTEGYDPSASPGGAITPSGAVLVGDGADAGFTITPDTGYRVKDVRADGVSQGQLTSYTFPGVSTDHAISASFIGSNYYLLTATAGAGGTISPAGSNWAMWGSNLTFNITPNPGYRVTDVLVNGVSQGPVTTYNIGYLMGDTTISASFEADTHTITAGAGTGGAISPLGAVIVNDGADQAFTITPDEGYRILDVVVDGNPLGPTSSYTFTGVTADHTIQASFTLDSNYIVTVSSNAIDFITPRSAVPVTPGGSGVTFTIETATASYWGMRLQDFLVDGVSMGPDVTTYTFNNVTADHAVTATFTSSLNYVLWATNGPGGSISPYGGVAAPYGTNQTFTITPETGYHIAEVLVDGNPQVPIPSSYDFTYIMGNHNISATFAPDVTVHTITASAGTGGSITPSGTVLVADGADQSFSVVPNPGNYLVNVVVDGIDQGPLPSFTFYGVIGDHTIGASFAPNPVITAGAGPNGTINPSGAVSVDYGSGQLFSIAPNPGYHVADVLVDGSSVGAVTSYNFPSVTTNHTIQASFAVNTFNIVATAGPNGSINPTGTVTVSQGASQTFNFFPNPNYHVLSVLVDGVNVGAMSSYTFVNVLANRTIQVNFAPDPVITATAGPNGSISPSGAVNVPMATSQLFNIYPNTGYHVADVLVDGTSVGAVTSYTFNGVVTNHTISATFAANSHTITATAGANGVISPAGPVSVPDAGSQLFTMTPNAGYHVQDVLVDSVSVGPVANYTFNNVMGDHTIQVSFAANSYTINATAGPNGSITPSGAVSVNFGATQGFSITPNPNYHVADVLVDGVSVGAVTSHTFNNVTANHTIQASFALNTNTITASAGPNGSITPSGAVSVNYGANQSFTITPNTGYHVADVLVDGTSVGAVTSYTFNNVIANRTIQASFAVNTYTITASAGANGSIAPSGAVSVNHGASQTFNFYPNTNYHVLSVLVDGVNVGAMSSYTIVNVMANHTIQVNFAPDPVITATAGAGGSISPSGAVNVAMATSQTFNISPNTGYHVADVLVDGTSVGAVTSYTFNGVVTNHTISASFAPNDLIITASAGTGGGISPAGAVNVPYGTDQTFTITPQTGYRILGVWVDGVSVGAVTDYTFTNVIANHTINASFGPNPVITAGAGAGGSISPAGTVNVPYGTDQTFNFYPNTGYRVQEVLVDGVSVGAVSSYTFNNVITNHSIQVSFTISTFTITATAGPGGAISPAGTVPVNEGGSQSFSIIPAENYNILNVLVDGVSVGPVPSYNFANVTANHTIAATFVAQAIQITVDRDRIMVPYLGTGQFKVNLSSNPNANVTISVAWQSGNPNIQVQSGATLTFTPANWDIPQTVTLVSTEETGMIIIERTIFQLGATGLAPCQVTAMWTEKMPNLAPILLLLDEGE